MDNLNICPVCSSEFSLYGKSLICENGHNFDFSKEGYVNLLLGSKNGDLRGDSKESAKARHEFLTKDYYICLKDAISKRMSGSVLDICCGEGYYDEYNGELYGFDISKEMVRLAAKRNKGENFHYFVANLANIPIKSESIDTAIHLFAPFNDKEFSRILKPDGRFYSVIPGSDHLFQMKEVIYDSPYKNDEKAPETDELILISKTKVTDNVKIGKEDLKTLFSMTPYYYRTSESDRNKLEDVSSLNLTVSFVILEYQKKSL